MLARAPLIQCLAGSGADSQNPSAVYLPILTGIPLDDVANRTTASGSEVRCLDEGIELDAAWVARVELDGPDQLQILVSAKGDEAIRKLTNQYQSFPRMGLAVDGRIEGLSLESIRDRRLTFRMSVQSNRSLPSIQAAIRGPALPFELELLD